METEQERLPLLKTERETPRNEITGLLFMILAALLFGVMGVLVRYVTAYRGLALSTVVLVRGMTQTACPLLVMVLLPPGRGTFRNVQQLWKIIALRGASGALVVITLFGSFELLDFSIATSIFSTNTVLVLIFGSVALHEPVSPRTAVAALLSLVGCILVTDPFAKGVQTSVAGVLLGIAAASVSALSITTLRSIAKQVHFLVTVLSFGAFTMLAGLLKGGAVQLFKSAPNTGIALLAAVFGFSAQCTMAKGYEYCTAGKGALVRNIQLPLAYVLGIAFLGEVPNVVSLGGGLLILAATLMIAYEAMEKERQGDGD